MDQKAYVEIILRDETHEIFRETPLVYENARIIREYRFRDGAVVEYEWRDASVGSFNHQFTMTQVPDPNPENLSTGVIETIDY